MRKNFYKKFYLVMDKITDIVERHDFSILWSFIIIISSVSLLFNDFPPVIQETFPYDSFYVGALGLGVGVLKNIGIGIRNYNFHFFTDGLGSFWFIYMGVVMTTSQPPLAFVGVILFTAGIFVDIRLFIRGWRKKPRWTKD